MHCSGVPVLRCAHGFCWAFHWPGFLFAEYRSLMSLSHRLGILNRKVSSNPTRSATHRREDNNRVRFLTVAEGNKLREVIEAKWASHMPEFDMAINTGLRKGQSIRLDLGHGRLES
jgi:hypothetical protein